MKVEYGDLRDNSGEIRLLPESIDDLWHLEHLISPGDLVFATTFRSVETATDRIRPEKVEKRPVRLGIRVEKVEFSGHGIRLRVAGTIEHGVDCGAYHTINVETGYEISVIRQWRPIDLERIGRAVKASVFGVIHILTIEEGEAELFRLRQYGPESVMTLSAGSGKGGRRIRGPLFSMPCSHVLRRYPGRLSLQDPVLSRTISSGTQGTKTVILPGGRLSLKPGESGAVQCRT